MINDCRVPVLSSAIDFLFELEPRPTLRGVRVQCFQTAKGYGNVSSVRGKNPGIESGSPALHTDSLLSEPTGKPLVTICGLNSILHILIEE